MRYIATIATTAIIITTEITIARVLDKALLRIFSTPFVFSYEPELKNVLVFLSPRIIDHIIEVLLALL